MGPSGARLRCRLCALYVVILGSYVRSATLPSFRSLQQASRGGSLSSDGASLGFVAWFDDDQCTEVAGIVGFVSGQNFTLTPAVAETCKLAGLCLAAPEAEACLAQAVLPPVEVTVRFQGEDSVMIHDPTNSDREDERVQLRQCSRSTLLRRVQGSCFFAVIPAESMMLDARTLSPDVHHNMARQRPGGLPEFFLGELLAPARRDPAMDLADSDDVYVEGDTLLAMLTALLMLMGMAILTELQRNCKQPGKKGAMSLLMIALVVMLVAILNELKGLIGMMMLVLIVAFGCHAGLRAE